MVELHISELVLAETHPMRWVTLDNILACLFSGRCGSMIHGSNNVFVNSYFQLITVLQCGSLQYHLEKHTLWFEN